MVCALVTPRSAMLCVWVGRFCKTLTMNFGLVVCGVRQELVLAVDTTGGIVGTALLNPPEGTAAGHGATEDCAHLGFVAVDPSRVRQLALLSSSSP